MNKKVLGRYGNNHGHWVGDGFPVRTLFSYQSHGAQMSPFLLLDYAGPHYFEPTDQRRGVGSHPHRGFETVTIVYDGEVEHRDSAGGGGIIRRGDVQWMTAGGGIIHEEFHSPAFGKTGGPFRMVQLWVNLPATDKMAPPAYQAIVDRDIPVVDLKDGAGTARIIAGSLEGVSGPGKSFTPINMWDVRLARDASTTLPLPEGHTALLVILSGHAVVNGETSVAEAEVVQLDRSGTQVSVHADSDVTMLVLTGEPIDEPVVGYGPFVMNSEDEIRTAIDDFNNGRFSRINS